MPPYNPKTIGDPKIDPTIFDIYRILNWIRESVEKVGRSMLKESEKIIVAVHGINSDRHTSDITPGAIIVAAATTGLPKAHPLS
jgi:hypothetical protein